MLQRQATLNSITKILNALTTYKNKKQSEKDSFAVLCTAIVLSAPQAITTLTFTNDEETPKLEPTVAAGLSKALKQVLSSPNVDKIWSDSVSQTTPTENLLYKALGRHLNSNSGLTLQSFFTPPAATQAVVADPTTHLVYTDQNLSQYPNLISISITVDQLRGATDITSTKSLEITVTGDAANAPLSTQRLVMPNAKIDLSAVTNLTGLTVERADTTSAKLPNTVTSLTVGTTTQVTGATALTTLKLTGAAPVPTWATNGSITAANATLDLSAVTGLPATLDLSAISLDITTVILPTTPAVTNLTIPSTVTNISGTSSLTTLKLIGAAPVPTWATNGSLTNTNATLDLSAVTGLGSTLDLTGLNADITTVILPSTVTAIQNLPNTVTHLTANVQAFASIGAYNSAGNAISTFPTHITHVTVVDSTITSIGNWFFSECSQLSNVDLSGLTAVTSIGNSFFNGCTALNSVNLSGLTAVTSIGNSFFNGCTALNSVNLSGLTVVTSIGNWFFSDCTGLTSVDLSGLTAVTSTDVSFFADCTGLTSVDLSALTAVTSTDVSFFADCTGLTSVNLSGLTAVTSTDVSFFADCTGLTSVDLSALTAVTSTDVSFFADCTGLTSVNLSGLTAVTSIGDSFFSRCDKLISIDLSALTKVQTIAGSFFYNCTGLTSVDLSGLTAVILIGNWFFSDTPKLVTLTAKANTGANGTFSTATVTAITGQIGDKFTRINLTGNATSLPAWVNNTSMTATNATLDLSAMTGLSSPFSFATITNAEIKTLILPSGVTQSNTTGWTNSSGTTWTR